MIEKDATADIKPVAKPRLTNRQWAQEEAMYAMGDTTQAAIAAKYSLTVQAVFQHMKRRGIKKGSKAVASSKAIEEGIQLAAVSEASVTAARIKETKEDHYKMASALSRLSWQEVLKAKQDGLPVSTATPNLRALDLASAVLKRLREERYAILGLDRHDFVDEDALPELVISELTDEQIAKLHERDDDFNEMQGDDNAVIDLDEEDSGK